MKIAKRALILYIAGLMALAGHLLLLSSPPTNLFTEIIFYLAPAAVLFVGLVLGWFGFMTIQYSKRVRSFYLLGLNLSFTFFLIVLGFFQIQARLNDRRYGYDPSGRDMLERADEDGRRYVVNGFENLQHSFPDPRQVHLLGYRSTYRDTTVYSKNDSIITVYYTYFLGKDSAATLFSKMELWKERSTIIAFNQFPTSDTVYQRLNKNYYEWRRKKADSIISLLKSIK
jgi:hypothetical protein